MRSARRRFAIVLSALAIVVVAGAPPASAQGLPIDIGGYAMFGNITFTATESFEAILDTSSGPIVGGGARVGLPLGGLFVDIGAWRFQENGERAFIFGNEVIRLGIPVRITITPLELSAGWRFRFSRLPRLFPYAMGGYTSMKYQETSDFSTPAEDVDETFKGYHLAGGAEYKILRWLGVAGEASWTTVPDSIGESGVSDTFNETDLGGKTFRFKITIGR